MKTRNIIAAFALAAVLVSCGGKPTIQPQSKNTSFEVTDKKEEKKDEAKTFELVGSPEKGVNIYTILNHGRRVYVVVGTGGQASITCD